MRTGKEKVPILMYHHIVADGEADRLSLLMAIEESRFLAQMRYVVEHGIEALTVRQFLDLRKGERDLRTRGVVISFDDGYENAYTRALPILEEVKLKATFFVISGMVGRKEYMDWPQLVEMKLAGMNIESHSHSHPVLTKLPPDKIREELRISKEILEQKLGSKATVLSVPGGFINSLVSGIAQEVGYEAVCTSMPGLNDIRESSFQIKRLGIKGLDSMPMFDGYLFGSLGSICRYRLRQAGLSTLRNILGLGNYERAKIAVLSRLPPYSKSRRDDAKR